MSAESDNLAKSEELKHCVESKRTVDIDHFKRHVHCNAAYFKTHNEYPYPQSPKQKRSSKVAKEAAKRIETAKKKRAQNAKPSKHYGGKFGIIRAFVEKTSNEKDALEAKVQQAQEDCELQNAFNVLENRKRAREKEASSRLSSGRASTISSSNNEETDLSLKRSTPSVLSDSESEETVNVDDDLKKSAPKKRAKKSHSFESTFVNKIIASSLVMQKIRGTNTYICGVPGCKSRASGQ